MRYQIFDASKIVLVTFVFSAIIMQLMKKIDETFKIILE